MKENRKKKNDEKNCFIRMQEEKQLIFKSISILKISELNTTKKVLVHIIINMIVLAFVPVLLVIIHMLMGGRWTEFALCPANFSVSHIHTILLNNFVHLSWEHVRENILGYTTAVTIWILPFLISQLTRQLERKIGSPPHRAELSAVPRYWLHLILNILAASLTSSFAWIYFRIPACTLGFSSVIASLYGFSYYYWAKLLGIYCNDSILQLTYVSLAILLYSLFFVETMEQTIWIVLLILITTTFVFILKFFLKVNRCIYEVSKALQNVTSKRKIYIFFKISPIISSICFLIIINLLSFITLFPINWLERGVNIFTHYVGVFAGFCLSLLITILENLNLWYPKFLKD